MRWSASFRLRKVGVRISPPVGALYALHLGEREALALCVECPNYATADRRHGGTVANVSIAKVAYRAYYLWYIKVAEKRYSHC